jgi:DNA-binding NtrC family response regulator
MRILLADEDELILNSISQFLREKKGHEVSTCSNGKAAFELYMEQPFSMVLADLRLSGITGLDLLQKIKSRPEGESSDIVLMTTQSDVNSSIEAMRTGAYDYLIKPIRVSEVEAVVSRISEHQALVKARSELRDHFDGRISEVLGGKDEKLKHIQTAYAEVAGIGKIGIFSDTMNDIIELTKRFHEDRSIPVMIEGETGTGKEVIARLIHYGEGKATIPLISINCTSIPANLFESELFGYEPGSFTGASKTGSKGKFELAQGGTIFLDEIGDMPLEFQTKLLRVIQEREIYRVGGQKKINLDVRIICATNRSLERSVEEGTFRSDLYYRLNTGRIRIPPLRERTGSIAPFAQMFLEKYASMKEKQFKYFQKTAIVLLESYSWPGNVRELENLIESIVLLYDDIEVRPEHLKLLLSGKKDNFKIIDTHPDLLEIVLPPEGLDMKSIEKKIMQKVLRKFDGNITRAAQYLDISRNTLRNRLQD